MRSTKLSASCAHEAFSKALRLYRVCLMRWICPGHIPYTQGTYSTYTPRAGHVLDICVLRWVDPERILLHWVYAGYVPYALHLSCRRPRCVNKRSRFSGILGRRLDEWYLLLPEKLIKPRLDLVVAYADGWLHSFLEPLLTLLRWRPYKRKTAQGADSNKSCQAGFSRVETLQRSCQVGFTA